MLKLFALLMVVALVMVEAMPSNDKGAAGAAKGAAGAATGAAGAAKGAADQAKGVAEQAKGVADKMNPTKNGAPGNKEGETVRKGVAKLGEVCGGIWKQAVSANWF